MNVNDIIPAGDVLVVEEIKPDEKMESGLFVPGQAMQRDSLVKAKILRAGPGREHVGTGAVLPHIYKEGDVVIFDKMRGFPMSYGGMNYLLVNAGQVFGSVKETSILEN